MSEHVFLSRPGSLLASNLARRLRATSTDPVTRGFAVTSHSHHLSNCASAFMQGGIRAADTSFRGAIHAELGEIDASARGFAYEGAAMVALILDRLIPGRGWRVPLLLSGDGFRFRYLVHVGVGWGMARLGLRHPRTSWGLDPLLRWLALDGLGFHDAFFASATGRQKIQGTPVSRATDHLTAQGTGRALWFVYGAHLGWITAMIEKAHPTRRNALWAGVGLAASYAGTGRQGTLQLKQAAGPHATAVQQGMTFGHAARDAQGLAPDGGLTDRSCPDAALVRAVQTARPLTTRHANAGHFRMWQRQLESMPSERPLIRLDRSA